MLNSQVCVITFTPSCLLKIINSIQLLPHSLIHATRTCLFPECQEGTALQEMEEGIDIHFVFKRFVGKMGCYLRSNFLETAWHGDS